MTPMNLSHLVNLKKKLLASRDLNPMRQEITEEFDRVIHFIQDQLEKDVKNIEQDVENLSHSSAPDASTREIIGHLIMDFSELRKDLETEI